MNDFPILSTYVAANGPALQGVCGELAAKDQLSCELRQDDMVLKTLPIVKVAWDTIAEDGVAHLTDRLEAEFLGARA